MQIYSNRKRGTPAFVILLLMLVAAILAGGGVYYWQTSSASSLDSRNEELENQIGKATAENNTLKNQIAKLEKDIKALNEKPKENLSMGKRAEVQNMADKVLNALKSKDMKSFAALVHPDKGVRFTPYSNVNLQKDIVIKAADVSKLATDATKRVWGAFDGSGSTINYTFMEYYNKFIYDADFLEAPQIVFNQPIQRGNSILNVKETYPSGTLIEYYFPGFDKKYNGMDWKSLILIFEQKGSKWYLVGVVHQQWTI